MEKKQNKTITIEDTFGEITVCVTLHFDTTNATFKDYRNMVDAMTEPIEVVYEGIKYSCEYQFKEEVGDFIMLHFSDFVMKEINGL